VELRYALDDGPEVYEISISWEETQTTLLHKLGRKGNHFVVDKGDHPFARDDNLFSFATTKGVQPVRIIPGLKMGTMKTRVKLPLKDNREKIEIKFGEDITAY
jgi:uncharacterized membrane protein